MPQYNLLLGVTRGELAQNGWWEIPWSEDFTRMASNDMETLAQTKWFPNSTFSWQDSKIPMVPIPTGRRENVTEFRGGWKVKAEQDSAHCWSVLKYPTFANFITCDTERTCVSLTRISLLVNLLCYTNSKTQHTDIWQSTQLEQNIMPATATEKSYGAGSHRGWATGAIIFVRGQVTFKFLVAKAAGCPLCF